MGGSTVHTGAGSGGGSGQSQRNHDPEIMTLPSVGQADHLNHYYKAHHFNNNMLGLNMISGMLNNKPNPSSQNQASTMKMGTSGDPSNPCSTSPPLPIPIPMAMTFHGTLKGLNHVPNMQTEPLLLSNGSKESVQETQIWLPLHTRAHAGREVDWFLRQCDCRVSAVFDFWNSVPFRQILWNIPFDEQRDGLLLMKWTWRCWVHTCQSKCLFCSSYELCPRIKKNIVYIKVV